MKINRKWATVAVVWMAMIFCFTQLPYFTGDSTARVIKRIIEMFHHAKSTPDKPNVLTDILNFLIRKATHLTVFGILGLLFFKTLQNYKYSYLYAWILTFVYAMTDEYHQSLVPNRTSSFRDVLIDSFGALVVLLITFAVNRKRLRGQE